jgi:hypothetical protein
MKSVHGQVVKEVAMELNDIIDRHAPESVLSGLEIISLALGELIQVYSNPNPNNPAGMVDNANVLRSYCAELLTGKTVTTSEIKSA